MPNSIRQTIESNPDRFQLVTSPYVPHEPTGKQAAFLMLSSYREAFYGGAAGGGKALALDTLVATTVGLVKLELLRVGNLVLDWKINNSLI